MFISLISFSVLYTLFIHKLYKKFEPDKDFGLPNIITLSRGFLTFIIIALFLNNPSDFNNYFVFIIASIALSLDGADGYFARKMNKCTSFGARFDMESDAFFMLVLSFIVFWNYQNSYWVLLIGGMRYIYVILMYCFDFLNLPVKERYSRKVICVVQILVLLLPFLELFSKDFIEYLLISSLILLLFSFGRDAREQFIDYKKLK